MPQKTSINLLTQPDFRLTPWGKISLWSLSVGRWIVIITELIVISAFVYRFKLDQDISALQQDVEQKRGIITYFAPLEKQFRETQKRLSVLGDVLGAHQDMDPLVSAISRSLPEELALTGLSVNSLGQLRVLGISKTEESISNMINNLRQDGLFSDVRLDRVELDGNQAGELQYSFDISMKIIKY